MVIYEVYLRGREEKGNELIGVLPERRSDPKRINPESIEKWSKTLFDEIVDVNNLFFIQRNIH